MKALVKFIKGDAVRSHVQRVESLYKLILGRPPESPSIAEDSFGLSAEAMLSKLVASALQVPFRRRAPRNIFIDTFRINIYFEI